VKGSQEGGDAGGTPAGAPAQQVTAQKSDAQTVDVEAKTKS
jgi:hypothetical protein